jgi:hypothetical protein
MIEKAKRGKNALNMSTLQWYLKLDMHLRYSYTISQRGVTSWVLVRKSGVSRTENMYVWRRCATHEPAVLVKSSRLKVKSGLKTNYLMMPETVFLLLIVQRCPSPSALLGCKLSVEVLEVRR